MQTLPSNTIDYSCQLLPSSHSFPIFGKISLDTLWPSFHSGSAQSLISRQIWYIRSQTPLPILWAILLCNWTCCVFSKASSLWVLLFWLTISRWTVLREMTATRESWRETNFRKARTFKSTPHSPNPFGRTQSIQSSLTPCTRSITMEWQQWTRTLSVSKKERSSPCSDQMELESHLCSTLWLWTWSAPVVRFKSSTPIWTTSTWVNKDSRWECALNSTPFGMFSVSTRVLLSSEKSKVYLLLLFNSRKSSSRRLWTLEPTHTLVLWISVEVIRENLFAPCPLLLAQRLSSSMSQRQVLIQSPEEVCSRCSRVSSTRPWSWPLIEWMRPSLFATTSQSWSTVDSFATEVQAIWRILMARVIRSLLSICKQRTGSLIGSAPPTTSLNTRTQLLLMRSTWRQESRLWSHSSKWKPRCHCRRLVDWAPYSTSSALWKKTPLSRISPSPGHPLRQSSFSLPNIKSNRLFLTML